MKNQTNRELNTGRYAYDDMDLMCECGHSLGHHAAAVTKDEQPCFIADIYWGPKDCPCVKFKKST